MCNQLGKPDFTVSVQFMEIYNEEILDLLNVSGHQRKIRIHEGRLYFHYDCSKLWSRNLPHIEEDLKTSFVKTVLSTGYHFVFMDVHKPISNLY